MNELDSNDRYHLKKVQMDVDRKTLEAQRAQQELDRLILDLEHKYELIGNEQNIDPRTATISDNIVNRNNKGNGKELLESIALEANKVLIK